MSNNSYSIGNSYISWNEDFTKVRLADRFDDICMAASTLAALVSRLSLREDNSGCGVVPDTFSKEDIVYQKYREGILLQRDKTAIFFSYEAFEKLVINFDKAQEKVKAKEISYELTSKGWLIGGGPVILSGWQMEAIYANLQEEEKVNLQFGDIDIIFYDDHIQFICEDVEYSLEQFTAMMKRWKTQQNKENKE